jgi:hypothetical protein
MAPIILDASSFATETSGMLPGGRCGVTAGGNASSPVVNTVRSAAAAELASKKIAQVFFIVGRLCELAARASRVRGCRRGQ